VGKEIDSLKGLNSLMFGSLEVLVASVCANIMSFCLQQQKETILLNDDIFQVYSGRRGLH
jgi:hypothetical protein